MSSLPIEEDDMPAEVDFSRAVRGLHHIPPGAKVFLPASVECSAFGKTAPLEINEGMK